MRDGYLIIAAVLVVAVLAVVHEVSVSGLQISIGGSGGGYGGYNIPSTRSMQTPASISGNQWQRGTSGGGPSTGFLKGQTGPGATMPEICDDLRDNDFDRKVDCDDVECKRDAKCTSCKVSARVFKLVGQSACVDGVRMTCKKLNSTVRLDVVPCPAGKSCYGAGSCR